MSRPTARQIMAATAADHGLTMDALIGVDRTHRVSMARFEAMARVRAERDLSLPAIGRLFGGRHHTTVLHAIRVHERREGAR